MKLNELSTHNWFGFIGFLAYSCQAENDTPIDSDNDITKEIQSPGECCNDWQKDGLSGKVKYIKEVSTGLTQETFYSKAGYKDSVINTIPSTTLIEVFVRDDDDRILEIKKYEYDTLYDHQIFQYREGYLYAKIVDENGKKLAEVSFNSSGLELFRNIEPTFEVDKFTNEAPHKYSPSGRVLQKKEILHAPSLPISKNTKTTKYTYDDNGKISSMTISKHSKYHQSREEYEFNYSEFDKNGNWTSGERNELNTDDTMPIEREYIYY